MKAFTVFKFLPLALAVLICGLMFFQYYIDREADKERAKLDASIQAEYDAKLKKVNAIQDARVEAYKSRVPNRWDSAFDEKVIEILKEASSIKAGCTRSDLEKYFTTEGGTFSPSQRRYVSRRCPYIKIDVIFTPTKAESPEDSIESVSKPFLEGSVID